MAERSQHGWLDAVSYRSGRSHSLSLWPSQENWALSWTAGGGYGSRWRSSLCLLTWTGGGPVVCPPLGESHTAQLLCSSLCPVWSVGKAMLEDKSLVLPLSGAHLPRGQIFPSAQQVRVSQKARSPLGTNASASSEGQGLCGASHASSCQNALQS